MWPTRHGSGWNLLRGSQSGERLQTKPDLTQDWLHNLPGTVQNECAGPFVKKKKLLGISRY